MNRSPRATFVVTYDICDPKRLRKVFVLMKGYGEHLQLSVFRCDLSPTEMVELRLGLSRLIKHDEDQVLFIDVGPSEGRGTSAISALGLPYGAPVRRPLIV